MLPQPDFDYFGAAARQMEKYSKPAPYGNEVADADTGTFEHLMLYYRHTLIRAYHNKKGVCPGVCPLRRNMPEWAQQYPLISPARIPFLEVGQINLEGAIDYVHHGGAVIDFLKDKGMAPADLDVIGSEAAYAKVPIEEKNFLLWSVTGGAGFDITAARGALDTMHYDVKADDKPEAKKPFGRWFFSAHGDIRLVQSEYEHNVSELAKYAPGVIAGRSIKETREKMNDITKVDSAALMGTRRILLLSFDLDAFSPSYPGDVHRATDAINAEVFGVPSLARAHDIHARGNVHYIKNAVHHVMPKPDRDFEGLSGKKNTLYHSAVMGYAVSRLRALNLIDRAGKFADLIDDGLLRLDLTPAQYATNIPRILQVIEKVYNLAGFHISWDKTLVSGHLSVFLNDIRYDGTLISPGLRAFLKVTHRDEAIAPSLLSELATLEATCRGAISANSFVNATYGLYVYGVTDLFRRWGAAAFKPNSGLAVVAFAPSALGGFSCANMQSMMANVAGPALAEGLANLRSIATRFRTMHSTCNIIINQTMRPMSVEAQMRAATAIRREGRVMRTTRAQQAIADALLRKVPAPVLHRLLGGARQSFASMYQQVVIADARVAYEALRMLWQSSMDHALDTLAAKFMRSRTAMALVRPRVLFRAAIANKTEAVALFREWNR